MIGTAEAFSRIEIDALPRARLREYLVGTHIRSLPEEPLRLDSREVSGNHESSRPPRWNIPDR